MYSKLTSRSQKIEKIGSTDWLPELIETCGKIRLLVVGATIESNANFRLWIKGRNKEIEVRGLAADPMPDDLHNKIRSQLNDFQPNLLLIGMGMPLQETILTELNGDFHCVVACVGGAIDQLGGKQSNCPRWLAGLGFEWLWRLISNPRRLAGRYLLEPFLLLRLLLVKKLDS
jgi:N-acetylglucosaminyldiphosphoundecaprenol N-acetyl-beta-D-mannosaminyltransferase